MWWSLSVSAIIVSTLLMPGSAIAMMAKIPLEHLVRQADLILLGRVESVQYQKIPAESVHGMKKEIDYVIINTAEISAERVVKGSLASQKIFVEFPGGIEDSPNYKSGEEVIVFLKKVENKELYITVGMLQGKLTVRDGSVEGENVSTEEFLKRITAMLPHM